jgi:small subunit ribosomal protein S17
MPKREIIGVVTRAGASKTRRVEFQRLVKHEVYGKYVRRNTVCHAHDEGNESKLGDTVQIVECRPLSKLKRWTLVRIVKRNEAVDDGPAGEVSIGDVSIGGD